MLKIGLTGILGSGKSTVAAIFESLNVPVIDVDLAGHWVLQHNETAKQKLVEAFGKDILENGQINRKRVGKIVFANEAHLKRLNEIVHPLMLERVDQLVNELEGEGNSKYLIINAALIFELGVDKQMDYNITVSAPVEACIQRTQARDGLPREQILKRMAAQLSQEEKIARSDFVITNDQDLNSLEQQVKTLHNRILQTTVD